MMPLLQPQATQAATKYLFWGQETWMIRWKKPNHRMEETHRRLHFGKTNSGFVKYKKLNIGLLQEEIHLPNMDFQRQTVSLPKGRRKDLLSSTLPSSSCLVYTTWFPEVIPRKRGNQMVQQWQSSCFWRWESEVHIHHFFSESYLGCFVADSKRLTN